MDHNDEHILKNILKTKEESGVRHSRRGHNFMLTTQTYKNKYRKNFFSLRITNIWNKLPHHVVNASSLTLRILWIDILLVATCIMITNLNRKQNNNYRSKTVLNIYWP